VGQAIGVGASLDATKGKPVHDRRAEAWVGEGLRRVGASPAQAGLAWLLAHRDNVLLIPGTSSIAHLEENMKIAGVGLSEEDVAELEQAVEPAEAEARQQ